MVLSATKRAFIPTLSKGLEEWYIKRPAAPVAASPIDETTSNHTIGTSVTVVCFKWIFEFSMLG